VSDPMPVSKSVRQMSDEEIVKTFDQLVEAWEGREAERGQLKAFDRDYLPPEPPATVIRSTESLIEYTRQRWRYEQKREEIDNRIADHYANYNTTSERVRFLLPPGHTLLHTYRGDQEDLQGSEFTIEHEKTVSPTRIVVRSRWTRPLT
jgi:Ribonuclease G/E